jgi:hypothetical protein
MKNQLFIHTGSHLRPMLFISAICMMGFTGCAATSDKVGHVRSGAYLTIPSREYNPETNDFERPWPFGPE